MPGLRPRPVELLAFPIVLLIYLAAVVASIPLVALHRALQWALSVSNRSD